jgi:hypothetical protein
MRREEGKKKTKQQSKTLTPNRPRPNTSVGKGINDGSLELSVSNGLVDSGDILADGLVIPTGHADQTVNTDVVELLKVLLAVHLDLQLDPDEFVHLPRLREVVARRCGSMGAIEERLGELSVESGQPAGKGFAESGDAGDICGQGWGGQQMVNEWSGAGLGGVLHPVSAIHGGSFIKCGHDGTQQLQVDDRCTKVRHEFFFEDLREPRREFRLQGAEIHR